MFDPIELRGEFFEGLTRIDAVIVGQVAREPCRDCGGPLYRGDYPRKPRGGLLASAAEAFGRRFSLCCGRDGCRSNTSVMCRGNGIPPIKRDYGNLSNAVPRSSRRSRWRCSRRRPGT
jgi:hypothetical protein